MPEPISKASTLRIVLFGMPGAGKTSLLGALSQAAQAQENVLQGRLRDHSKGLLEIQRRLYADRPPETLEEVTAYPVAVEPLDAASHPAREAVLVDCDGRVANELLSRRQTPGRRSTGGALARAILAADTLVLVVDASASAEILQRDFGQFYEFLQLLQLSRGRRSEVGGLPVYLVLSKCDLIARDTDTMIAWMERMEERKRQVGADFQQFLASPGSQAPVPFGRIDLHLWATAVRRPALKDAPAKPREPYGVAELFRQCLDSAAGFRLRQARARRRLRVMFAGVLGMMAAMLLLVLYFVATRPDRQTAALESEIRAFRSRNDRPAELFKDPVQDRMKPLQRIAGDAEFRLLPAELKDYVAKTLGDLDDYQRYTKAFLDKVPDPRYARSLEELDKIETSLRQMPLPPSHELEWAQTRAAQRRRQWEQDVEVLRREVNRAVARLTDLIRRAQGLTDESISLGEYRKLREELLREDERLPYRESERNRFLPGSNRLTYDNVMQFERVENLWREWQEAKPKMK